MVRNSKSVANLPVNPLTCLLTEVSDLTRAGWKPNGARSPGQAKRHPGFSHSRVSAPCKGKSFNPSCCYSYLIAELAVLKWNIVCICSIPAPCLKAFALTVVRHGGLSVSIALPCGARTRFSFCAFRLARAHAFCFLQNCLHSALLAIIVLIISAIRSVDNFWNNLHYHLHYLHAWGRPFCYDRP